MDPTEIFKFTPINRVNFREMAFPLVLKYESLLY